MIAWCTKPGRGTRLIPAGAIQGVQFMKTPAYVQVVGYLDQAQLNINSTDFGGEMDPHGADLRGNPMGGLVYSNGFGSNTDLNAFTQVIEWHNFMGSNTFCFKACDPSNTAQNGTFESCLGDNQDFPGVYTDSTGATQTYHQPPESLGPIPQLTWTARVPASSSCVTHQSTEIFSALLSVTASETGLGGGPTATPKPSGSTGTTKGSSSTKAPGATSTSSDAQAVVASGLVGLLGVVFSVLAFA